MVTPPDEIDRINERLERESQVQIQDRDSYDLAFNDLISTDEDDLSLDQKRMRTNGFGDYRDSHPDVSAERLFSKAKGKDLRRDRLKTAKRVVTTRKDYIKERASKVDLKGYDTARQRISKGIRIRRTFTVPSRIRGKVVFAVRTSVRIPKRRNRIRFILRNKLKRKLLTPLELKTLENIDVGKKIPRLYVQKFGKSVVRYRDSLGRFASARVK